MNDDKKEFFEKHSYNILYNITNDLTICNTHQQSPYSPCKNCPWYIKGNISCFGAFREDFQIFLRMKKLEKLLSQ